ncbi:tyrosine-type recombinase/integrase [Paenibacillus cymbidii]|uniref:tyrosine-type recombinase/integrase n=1 Tax=Paenibacillus cymbidii TaxID=1639034 RepID=UPI00108117BF|nr:tyrosine-type recombinase/integrase [Paenibacillus cymbidii]
MTQQENFVETAVAITYDTAAANPQHAEAVRMFLMDCRCRNLSPYTIEGYHVYLTSFQRKLEAWQLSLDTLTPKDLSVRMINEMLEQNLKPNTINGKIRTLQQFFKFLYHDGQMQINLADTLKPIKNDQRVIHTFTEEQVQHILAAPDRNTFTGLRDYTIMLLFLETGIRVMEMYNLTIPDINFEENTVLIRMGKGRKFRSIPIQATCIDSLKHYIAERGSQSFDKLWITVFDSPMARNSMIHMVKDHMAKAEITGVKGACHIFRHTMAKFFLLNGGDIFTLQYLLGHANLEMTRYYVELFNTDLHKQHEKYSPIENLTNEADFAESEVE